MLGASAPDVVTPAPAELPGALQKVARQLSQAHCAGEPAGDDALKSALRSAGILDGQVAHCIAQGRDGAEARAALSACMTSRRRALAATVEEAASVETAGGACACGVLVRRVATMWPIPETAAPFAELPLTATLSPGARKPQWLLMDPRGRVEVLPARTVGNETRASATLHSGAGRYVVQLMVGGEGGPEVAAQVSVQAGPGGPSPTVVPVPPDASLAEDPAGALYEVLRLHRSRSSLSALGRSAPLETTARARLEALTGSARLRHVQEDGADMVRIYRAQAGAPPVSRLAEVLAAGPTLAAAFQALLGSPAHRRQLDDPAFTHAGVAAARTADTGEWLVVMALGRAVDGDGGDAPRAEVLARLNAERSRRGLRPLTLEPTLQPLAEEHAALLARKRGLVDQTPAGIPLSDVALERTGANRAGVQLYRVTRPSEVTANASVLDARYRQVAIGLKAGQGIDGLYVVVILLEP
ncbi:MAG: CAP domain-containing protein [Myxococcota bacterium]